MVFVGVINFVIVMIIIIIMLLIHHPLRVDAASELLNQVCSKTQTPDFCVTTLSEDRGADTADLKGLDYIALDFASRTAAENNALVDTLRKNTTDPVLSANLAHCSVNYGGTIYALQQSTLGLDSGNFTAVGEVAGIAVENTKDCERVLVGGPTHTSPLAIENHKLIQLAAICDVIIALLA